MTRFSVILLICLLGAHLCNGKVGDCLPFNLRSGPKCGFYAPDCLVQTGDDVCGDPLPIPQARLTGECRSTVNNCSTGGTCRQDVGPCRERGVEVPQDVPYNATKMECLAKKGYQFVVFPVDFITASQFTTALDLCEKFFKKCAVVHSVLPDSSAELQLKYVKSLLLNNKAATKIRVFFPVETHLKQWNDVASNRNFIVNSLLPEADKLLPNTQVAIKSGIRTDRLDWETIFDYPSSLQPPRYVWYHDSSTSAINWGPDAFGNFKPLLKEWKQSVLYDCGFAVGELVVSSLDEL